MKRNILLIIFIALAGGLFAQKFDLAKTPPMGWNSWNKFGCRVNEEVVIKAAESMVSSGMKDAGYEYIVIDDCWQIARDENGEIIVDSIKFPNGMKYLADKIHSLGLKFGIYTCAGLTTCQKRPGSRGYEFQDARAYARWGVDYLKVDWCYRSPEQSAKASYSLMRDALNAAGRPIVLSICEWGDSKPWLWAKEVGHLARTTADIRDNWDSMVYILNEEKPLAQYSEPGYWNDPDMLEVGNGGMTTNEYKAHFSLWCMLAAPLMAGNDLSNMTEDTRSILTNKNLIAVNQDKLGKQAVCIRESGGYEIWIKDLDKEEKAACLFNRSEEEKEVLVNFNRLLRVKGRMDTRFQHYEDSYVLSDYKILDLWDNKEVKIGDDFRVMVKIPPHSVKVYRFIKNANQ